MLWKWTLRNHRNNGQTCIKKGGMAPKEELLKKWLALMETTKHRERAEAIYAQYEKHELDRVAKISFSNEPTQSLVMPSIVAMAKTATAALVNEAKAVSGGVEAVASEEIARRLSLCNKCEFFLHSEQRCSKCGCYMKFKAKLRSASCPVGKW